MRFPIILSQREFIELDTGNMYLCLEYFVYIVFCCFSTVKPLDGTESQKSE